MTPIEAAQEIFDALADADGRPVQDLDGLVDRVFFIEPRAGNLATPISATVSVDGQTGTEIQASVRVYGKLGQLDAVTIQQRVIDAWTVIDGLIDQTSIWTRGTWTNIYDSGLDSIIATCPMSASRDDF